MLDHRPWPSLKEILPFFSFLLFSLLFAAPGFSQAADISYSYDSLGRLVRANFGPGNSQSYTYDAGGNRTSVQNDGGGGGTTPVLTQLDPSQIVAGGSGFTLQVNGNNFTADSIIRWNGSDRSTTFVSATQLKASISSSDIASPTSAQVTVYLGGTGGGTSNSLPFMVIDPAAALFSYISLNPTHVTAGDSSTGSVVLSKPAPTGGAVVTLASSDPTATVPVNVTVPAGGTSAVFSITTSAVSLSTAVKISGNYNGLNRTATLVVASPGGGGQLGTVFVPAVLSATGLNNSFFTSEITFTNRGSGQAVMDFSYTAAFGGGTGTGSDVLSSGGQVIYSDAISYLKSLGIPIPDSGSRGGTLSIRVSGLNSPSDVGITVRTTTGVSQGRCGLAYPGIATSAGLQGTSYVAGLRQNAADRSNVAVQNMGADGDGDITLRVTVFSGDPNAAASQVLPDVVLPPGGFSQFSEILNSNGLSYSNGYVRVERVSGSAPYFAYGVINDQNNSDGSFVPPAVDSLLTGKSGMTLPVIVETGLYSSELVIANWSNVPRTVNFAYVASAITAPLSTANFSVSLQKGEQIILPDLVQHLRDQGTPGIGPAGPSFAGALFASVDTGDMTGLFLGARTSTPGGGGRFGLFYTGVPYGSASTSGAWVFALQQNTETRSNLALVNTGETSSNSDTFTIELYDGASGTKTGTITNLTLNPREWKQINSILDQYAPGTSQGYARIIRTAGDNPFLVYGVVNDGGKPGERSGDGAFVGSAP